MTNEVEFTFHGDRRGVLLVHGLTGTPNEMRLLGKGLNRAGFTVHGVQLAGHCGSADDLLGTTWTDWYHSVETAAEQLRERCDHVFVGGLSMGALLALHLAAQRPELVAGVGVFGATFRYDGWSIPRHARLAFMLPVLKKFRLARHRVFQEAPPYGIRDERLRAAAVAAMNSGDSTLAGLPGNPWYALAEMLVLSAKVRRELPKITAPCLVAHATHDDVASLANAYLVRDRVSGPVQMLLLDDSYHMITIDRERRQLIAATTDFFARIAATPLRDAA
jgi:carboxylesterase